MQIAVDVARVVLALYLLFNGVNHFSNLKMMTEYTRYKKVPAPGLAVVVTGLMLLFGGVSILFGFLVPWGIGVTALFLVAAAVLMHNFWVEEDPMSKTNQMANFLKNFALAAALVMLLAVPSWKW
ncbi:MAG: DoxX family protein [Firmicutes bacterium]|nr:DoxX family protein [Bacillota bacterium]